jgi:hypothetical protein
MNFHVSAAKKVLDPYDWLPASGETGVEFRSDGMDVILEISFRKDVGATAKRELRFTAVSSFRRESFPGPAMPAPTVTFDSAGVSDALGSLIEFENSDVANAWSSHYGNRRRVRHYVMHFLSENFSIQVLATGFDLGEERDAN